MENSQKLSGLKILCISASNRIDAKQTNSYRKCKAVLDEAVKHIADIQSEIIELQNQSLRPCIACSKCSRSSRCATDDIFNQIYEKITTFDILFIVCPHYEPIPAKLCMILEKVNQIAYHKKKFLQSESFGIKTALITHGATAVNEAAQKKKKRILNDPIASALRTPQFNLIPFDNEWDTGICVQPIEMNYGGETLLKISDYVRKVINSL